MAGYHIVLVIGFLTLLVEQVCCYTMLTNFVYIRMTQYFIVKAIAGHHHQGRCCQHQFFSIWYLHLVQEHSSNRLGPIVLVPDWLWHQHFCSFQYWSDRMLDSPVFWHFKKLF